MSPGPDYHAWTHRPKAQGGTDPIEVAGSDVDWAVANGDTDEIIANNTVHSIPYDSVDIATNSECFQAGDATKPIHIVKSGWYMAYLEAYPGGSGFTGVFTVGLTFSGSGVPYNFGYTTGGTRARSSHYNNGSASILLGFQQSFGPVYMKCDDTHVANCGAFVYHYLNTPGTIDWNYLYLAYVYLGPGLDLPNSSTWAPDGEGNDEQFRTYF